MAKRKPTNPAKFDRCVKAVKAKGGAANAYAVCTAAGTRGNKPYSIGDERGVPIGVFQSRAEAFAEAKSLAETGQRVEVVWKGKKGYQSKWFGRRRGNPDGLQRFDILDLQDGNWQVVGSERSYSAKGALATYKKKHADWSKGRKMRAKLLKDNPAAQSVEAYKGFHGREPDELVTVTKQVHYHKHLAGAGKLEKLEVISLEGSKVILSRFKGALLAFNEKRTQLFIEGGDQSVNLREFGITSPHEMETLGDVVAVEYFTRKDHLRAEDGGTAIYRHKFSKPFPHLLYDVPNMQLIFSGGRYDIPDEGIDN